MSKYYNYRKFISLVIIIIISVSSVAQAATHTVQVLDPRSFSPNDLTIEVGDTVRWVNAAGGMSHDVTADDFSFGSVTASSFEFSRTFNSVAEILYHCTVHSSPGRNINSNQNGRVNVISSTTPADLAISSVNAVDGTYEPGDMIVVDSSIQNSGDQASGAFTLTLYASTDSSISPADTSLGSVQITDIAGGAMLPHQATGNFPLSIPDGSYFIGAIISFADSNAADNTAFDTTPVTVKTLTPADLELQSVNAVDGTYEPGDSIVVDSSIHNSGDQASGAFTLDLYASTDSNISESDTSLGSVQIADVIGGATLNHQAMGNIPLTVPDGSYFIGAVITFVDSNVTDNTAFDATQVTVKAVPGLSVGCDDDFVLAGESEFVINVSPNGVDDTLNLQCALDSAASSGMPLVRLSGASYRISSVIATSFTGSLSGISKTGTSVEVLDGSIDCAAMQAAGRTPAAIKFDGGDARIERMTLVAGSPCMEGALQTVLHFTGESALAGNCANNVIFGDVDRVEMLGAGVAGLTATAVSVFAEGSFLGGCKQTLLGTFKLNRSLVSGFATGLVTAMKAAAQVDVNFNEFSENLVAINMTDSNQNATITNNTISGDNTADSGYTGILAGTVSDNAPNVNRIVINNNTFNVNASFAQASQAVLFAQQGFIANISAVISNNRFNLDGASTRAIVSTDVNKGQVSANRFVGNGLAGVVILADRTPVNGWTVTSNTGFPTFSSTSADVEFGLNTNGCILGPDQGATLIDQGVGNSILKLGDQLTY